MVDIRTNISIGQYFCNFARWFICIGVHPKHIPHHLCRSFIYCEKTSSPIMYLFVTKCDTFSIHNIPLHGFCLFSFKCPFCNNVSLHLGNSSQHGQNHFSWRRPKINILIFGNKVHPLILYEFNELKQERCFSKESVYFPNEHDIHFFIQNIPFKSSEFGSFDNLGASWNPVINI